MIVDNKKTINDNAASARIHSYDSWGGIPLDVPLYLRAAEWGAKSSGPLWSYYGNRYAITSNAQGSGRNIQFTFSRRGKTISWTESQHKRSYTAKYIFQMKSDPSMIYFVDTNDHVWMFTTRAWTTSEEWRSGGIRYYGTFGCKYITLDGYVYLPGVTTFNQVTTPSVYFEDAIVNPDVCFLPGTIIDTPNGDRLIESISVGDEIWTFKGDKKTRDTVRWIGASQVEVRKGVPPDLSGYPVCVVKNAISAGVPSQNLLVTPEHCLYLNEKFIPVRMMVNERSIYYDTSFVSYEYYHLETETHSVIRANGALTESYLDTGNRDSFVATGVADALASSRCLTWATDAAAPLCTELTQVKKEFDALQERATTLGFPTVSPISHKSPKEIYLLDSEGKRIDAIRVSGQQHIFNIAAGTKSCAIYSHAKRPCDVVGPYLDDRRYFGASVGSIYLYDAHGCRKIEDHILYPDLTGWHEISNTAMRQSNGAGYLPISTEGIIEPAIISIEIRSYSFELPKLDEVIQARS